MYTVLFVLFISQLINELEEVLADTLDEELTDVKRQVHSTVRTLCERWLLVYYKMLNHFSSAIFGKKSLAFSLAFAFFHASYN